MSDIWETFNDFNNTVAAAVASTVINNGTDVTQCIEIALPSSVIREQYLLQNKKRIGRSNLGFLSVTWGKLGYVTQNAGGRQGAQHY